MTLGELDARMSWQELQLWAAYEIAYGPLGPIRMDHLMSIMASVLRNTFSKKRSTPAQFFPKWGAGSKGPERKTLGQDDTEDAPEFMRELRQIEAGE